MADHDPDCVMAACYTVRTCPVCGAKIRPAKPFRRTYEQEQDLDAALRARPQSGPFDIDANWSA
jgi:hypothetical protein